MAKSDICTVCRRSEDVRKFRSSSELLRLCKRCRKIRRDNKSRLKIFRQPIQVAASPA